MSKEESLREIFAVGFTQTDFILGESLPCRVFDRVS